jgi:tetratricopeptide (TPR) repeat protein
MAFSYEAETEHPFEDSLKRIVQPVLPQFDHIVRSYALLNMLFFGAIAIEGVSLLLFFPFLAKSALLAFGLALLFLTVFAYYMTRLYYQSAKPEQLLDLRSHFLNSFKTVLNYREGTPEHHIALANACNRLAENLAGKEFTFYPAPRRFESLTPWLQQFSAWWHWQDVHRMRELLLEASVDEHIKMVRCEPTSVEIHAALANAYLRLARLYIPSPKTANSLHYAPPPQRLSEKFKTVSLQAIEEFKIVCDYAPKDPWAHLQLAYCYHDLQMPKEEIAEYETLIQMNGEDKEALFKLGSLYFTQGLNAKGLRIYDELRLSHPKKAENLMKLYGTSLERCGQALVT